MEQVSTLSVYYFAQSMHIFVPEKTDCRQEDSLNGIGYMPLVVMNFSNALPQEMEPLSHPSKHGI
jgi:hypothetical protein